MWDLYWVRRLEKWKAALKNDLPIWFDSLKEFEALSSIATLWYNNDSWVFPTIQEGTPLEIINAGHPLIHQDKRIGNDISMVTRGHIKLITGSNMAGKSTLLRTVGLNIVLAQMGAPVCAEKNDMSSPSGLQQHAHRGCPAGKYFFFLCRIKTPESYH